MELQQVDALETEVRETAFGVLADVVGRKGLGHGVFRLARPLQVLGRHLGGDDQLPARMRAHHLAEQALAVPDAVGQGRVEEGAALLDGPVQRGQ